MEEPLIADEVKEIISSLQLEPHPEGGWFRRIFPAQDECSGDISTIYYLLGHDDFSAFHRLNGMTEIWYHLGGGPIDIHVIGKDGVLKTHRLGELDRQLVIQSGHWFAAEPSPSCSYCLVGCAVAPAFKYEGFELANRQRLLSEYPQHSALIKRLTIA